MAAVLSVLTLLGPSVPGLHFPDRRGNGAARDSSLVALRQGGRVINLTLARYSTVLTHIPISGPAVLPFFVYCI